MALTSAWELLETFLDHQIADELLLLHPSIPFLENKHISMVF